MNQYQPAKPDYPHQSECKAKMRGKESFAVLKAPRTGKSKVIIDDFGAMELAGECNDLLLMAPGGVYKTWAGAFQEHASDDLKARAKVFVYSSGMSKQKRKELEEFLAIKEPRTPRVLLVNCEAVSRPGEARELCLKFASQRACVGVLDESVFNKNPTAKRTKFNNRELASRLKFRRILSGLATPRSPLDLYAQFEFLDWRILGHKSFFTFRNRYAVLRPQYFGERLVQVVDGYRHEDELRKLIEPHSFRSEFRPKVPSTYTVREIEMTAEQSRIYSDIKTFATAQLASGEHVTATAVISQIMRLHQVLCGHTKDETGQEHDIPENKTAALLELLEDYDGKAIIWFSYQRDVEKVAAALRKEYGEESVARFYGGNEQTREQEELSFKNSSSCCFMLATPDAGRFGRTWDCADLVIFYSSKNDLDHRDQAEQRPLGVMKDRGVDYVDLITPGTVEPKILEALKKKISLASVINGDTWREWVI